VSSSAPKVVSLHAPQQDVIGLLRELLERAERGEVRAVAVAAHAGNEDTGTAFAMGDGNVAHLVCALERLKLGLLNYRG